MNVEVGGGFAESVGCLFIRIHYEIISLAL